MKNIGLEVMLFETITKRASAALVFKMSSAIKFEFKNYDDDSFAWRLSLFNHKLVPVVLSAFYFTVLIMPLKGQAAFKSDFLKDSYQAV